MNIPPVTIIAATALEIEKAFTEWERRYREEPKRFQSEAAKLLRETPETYGAACTPYFIAILGELGTPSTAVPPVTQPSATATE